MAQLVQAVLYNFANTTLATKTLYFPTARPPTVGNTLVLLCAMDKNKTVTPLPANWTVLKNELGNQYSQFMAVKQVVSGDVTNFVTTGSGISITLSGTANTATRMICLEISGEISVAGYNHNYIDSPTVNQVYSNKTGALVNPNGLAIVMAGIDSTPGWSNGTNRRFLESGYSIPSDLTTTGTTYDTINGAVSNFSFIGLSDPYTSSGIPGYAIGIKTGNFDPTGEGATFAVDGGSLDQMGAMIIVLNDAAVAPVLTSPTPSGTLGTRTSATLGATTDSASGTLYAVASTVAADIDNLLTTDSTLVSTGKVAGGGNAPFSASNAISSTSPTVALSGLSGSTTYYYALVQSNTAGYSSVIKGSFTTAASVRNVTLSNLGHDVAGVFTLLDNKAVKVWTATGTNAAASDGGANGLDATIMAGVLSLNNLTIAAGTIELRIKDPLDAYNSHIYTATAVEAS